MTASERVPEPPPFSPEQQHQSSPSRKTWQFSMRTMLIGMTAFAIMCAMFSAFPWTSGIVLGGLWLAISGFLLTGIVFAHNDKRAFCIGAAVVVASTWTGMGGMFLESLQRLTHGFSTSSGWPRVWMKHFFLLVSAIANGWLCIRARRYFEKGSDD